uniref:G_PROTEIN_RECEP_F1_2 domain-containing protein n=1 Tax=Meloidogyne hapla TaxID=6305 RepID=A0A1I8BMF4_MELHA
MTIKLMPKPELEIRRVSALFHVSSSPQFNNVQQNNFQNIQNQIMPNNKIHQQRLSIQQGEIGRPTERNPEFYITRPSIQSRISIQHDLPTPKQSLIQHERRLLLQAIVLFIVEFSLSTIWFLQMVDFLPDGMIANVLANWYWIFYNGFRPLVYLAMNKTIRTRLLSLWLNKQPESTAEFGKIPRAVQQEIMLVSAAHPITPRRPMPLVNEPI